MTSVNSSTPVILLAFANDAEAPLRELALELDELIQILDPARKEGKCQLITLAAATPEKIIKAFQQHQDRICIFHYGGHSDAETLFLREDFPGQNTTEAAHLAEFLGTQEKLELVFINGCLSTGQAEFYHSNGAKAVMVTDREIGDRSAREFAQLFYRSLAGGATITDAFQAAENGYRAIHRDLPRGLALRTTDKGLPWQLVPQTPHQWRLPLVAQHLTRIPTIDLEKEFIGREDDLLQLSDLINRTSRVLLVNGLGGIGKTVLATAYVQTYGNHYDHLIWINRGEDLIQAFALSTELADTLGMPFQQDEDLNNRFRQMLWKLQQLPGNNLLVIDNAQEQVVSKVILEQLPGPPYWRVLLTSRLELADFDRMRLDTLHPRAAKALFRTYFQGSYTETELEELLEEIGYHTLTIELLARLLGKFNHVLSLPELTTILRQRQLNDSDLQEKVWVNHAGENRSIFLHLMKAFELSELDEKEKWLLKQFIVLPVERYPVTQLADLLQEKSLGLNKILNSLATQGWLTLQEDKTFSIHRLVRQVAEYQLKPRFYDSLQMIHKLIEKISLDEFESFVSKSLPWINYATEVENYFTEDINLTLTVLQENLSFVFCKLGQYETAVQYQSKVVAARESLLRPNHPLIAASFTNIAVAYEGLRKFKKALFFQEKALAIEKEQENVDLNSLAISYNNIGYANYKLKQFDIALSYFKKALEIREIILDKDHPDMATTFNNLGLAYKGIKKYSKALEFHQKALSVRESVLDENHPSVAVSYNNIAILYRQMKEYEFAIRFHLKAITIRKAILDAEHPSLYNSYRNLAIAYKAAGEKVKAKEYYEKADAIKKEKST